MYAESNSSQNKGNESAQSAAQQTQKRRCANCDIEFLWSPVVVQGVTYCCAGCAAGGPCSCDYSQYRSVNIAGVIHYQSAEGGK
jgi:hypothetical protein